MIRVTVELLPASGGKPKHLGTALISNDGSLTRETGGDQGAYNVALSKWGDPNLVWRDGHVPRFNRVTRGPWDLLCMALVRTVGSRNKSEIRRWMNGV